MMGPLLVIVRPCALGLAALLACAELLGASPAWSAPAPAAPSAVEQAGPASGKAVTAGRKGKKRRRLRRKRIKPTRFQNVTPHQHLGPSISR